MFVSGLFSVSVCSFVLGLCVFACRSVFRVFLCPFVSVHLLLGNEPFIFVFLQLVHRIQASPARFVELFVALHYFSVDNNFLT